MRPFALLFYLFCLAPGLSAATLDLDLGGGPNTGTLGLGVSGDLDETGTWELAANAAVDNVTRTAAPSQTTSGGLNLSYTGDGAWSGDLGLDGANDKTNKITDLGPVANLSWTLRAGGASEDDEGDAEGDESASDTAELLTLTLGLGVHFYNVDLGANTLVAVGPRGRVFSTTVKGQFKTTQVSPSLTLQVPLFGGHVTPSLSYTRYSYSQDVQQVAAALEQRFLLGPGAGRVSSLMGSFYTQSFGAGLALRLPGSLTLSGGGARQQLAADDSWTSSADAALAWRASSTWKFRLGWSASIDQDTANSTYSAGTSVSF